MYIPISIYDEAEKYALINSIYPANRAFKPAAFQLVNFPTRVSTDTELIRYCDIMHELEDRKLCSESFYSMHEVSLMRKISQTVRSITKNLGRETSPYMAMFPPIPIFRVINLLAANELYVRPVNILEIGPGSGYLGSYNF